MKPSSFCIAIAVFALEFAVRRQKHNSENHSSPGLCAKELNSSILLSIILFISGDISFISPINFFMILNEQRSIKIHLFNFIVDKMGISFLNPFFVSGFMNHFNPWHDVSVGDGAPEVVHAIIEIPKDSHIKYEIDKESGMLKLDRFLYSAVHYPGDYGFIPRTLWEDGDPLDIIVLTHRPVYPLTLVNARVIGVIRMIDGEEKDDKIIAVYDKDPRYAEYTDLKNVPSHVLRELVHFFERYKELQGKHVKIVEVLNKDAAHKDVLHGQKIYREKYGKK